jgi:hypothetical protein
MKHLSAAALLLVVLVVVAATAGHVRGQLSGVTDVCTDAQRTILPSDLIDERIYFSMDVQGLQEFEYRLLANDNKPLGLLEIFDFNEQDDDGAQFNCYVRDTVDNTTCPNQYLANGQTQPIMAKRKIMFGFRMCPDYNTTPHSQSMTLRVFYRPLLPQTTFTDQQPLCGNLTRQIPTTWCAGAGVVTVMQAVAMLLAVALMALM